MASRLPDPLNPNLNPTGYMAAAGAVYAATVAIYNATHHHTALSVPVIVAAIAAVSALFTRHIVTPVAAPKDGNKNPLVTAPADVPAKLSSGSMTILPTPTTGAGTTSTAPTSTPPGATP